jgi:hypothetical protein
VNSNSDIDSDNRSGLGRETEEGSGRVIPLNSAEDAAFAPSAGRFPTAKPEECVFPACADARLDCRKPHSSNMDPSQTIKSWRTAGRRALKDACLEILYNWWALVDDFRTFGGVLALIIARV